MFPFRHFLRGVFSATFTAVFIGILFSPSEAYANLLGNPSFEDAIGNGTAGNWDATNGTEQITAPPAGGFSAIPDGRAAIALDATTDFTFQTNDEVEPGDFVSFSAVAESSVVAGGGSGGQLRIEFKEIDAGTGVDRPLSDEVSALITTTNAAAGGGYVRFIISGRAPERTARVVFTIRRRGANAGNFVVDNANGEINPVKLTVSASKTRVKAGDVVTVLADFTNASQSTLANVELKVEAPAGLQILTDTIRRNGAQAGFHEGSTIITLDTMGPGDVRQIVFQVLVTSGVMPGRSYGILLSVLAGGHVSQTGQVSLRVVGDPLFDEGTILGKVFDDRNSDGVQSKGEPGVPRVRIYTEYGVSVVTDTEGRFHLPAVQPGRHILKIDGHTLPAGTTFVTEESLLIKTTQGLLNKVRFAVRLPESALPEEFRKDLHLWVTQGIDLARPELRIGLEPDLLKVGLGQLEREATFRIKTNYGDYIAGWRLEVRSDMGEKVWTGVGISQPPVLVPWNGLTDRGEMIQPGVYAYRLLVRDSQDHEDWTPLQFFRVVHKAQNLDDGEALDVPAIGHFNVARDGRQSIPLVARPTLRIYGKAGPGRRVQVNGVPAETNSAGEFEQELFVTAGEKTVSATAVDSRGDSLTVEEKIKVKDSSFFLVALGEEEVGFNNMRGNLNTVGRDDTFHEDFYQDGRLAYYLKAKLKGKFLVKSRYDTGDERSALFTRLDPDEYYPIYGDYSQIDYEGQETQERLFILVEMDRSFLKWGSYETNFKDTELGRFNRTLSGLKIHHETLSSTRYGDAKRGFTLFWSKERSFADHNEFLATGGSLYYLRNRNVVQGSEKIRVEVRDKIQDIPVESRDLVYGRDYEIDYKQGRILLKEPLSSVAASDTIISNDILDGNPVFLVVDYEFESFRAQYRNQPRGLRAYTHLGDHVRIGGTAVEELRQNTDYDLRAVDVTLRSGRNTRVTAEYAEAKFQQVRQATSFDGGLSFASEGPLHSRRAREKAYLIKGETKPLEPVELSGYLQNVEPGFSVDRIKSQEGFRKYGFQGRLKVSEAFHLVGRHDSTEVSAQLRPLSLSGVSTSFEKLISTTGQAIYKQGQWNVIGEYLHQLLDIPIQNRINSIFSEEPFRNGVGLKIARKVSEWLTPYARSQYTFSGKNNFQAGGGVEIRAGERTKIFFEEMIGRVGDATLLGISRQQDEKTTTYATLRSRDLGFGEHRVSTSIGSSHQLTERSRIYSEREYSTYSGNLPGGVGPAFVGTSSLPGIWSSDIYGYEDKWGEGWDFGARFERRHLDADDFRNLSDTALANLARANTFNTLALSMGYTDPEKWKSDDSFEIRIDSDAPEARQWLTQNTAEWRVNRDLSFLGRANFGTSRFVEPGDLTGRFLEFGTGLAYRPVESDRINWLARYTFLSEDASDAQFSGTDSGTVAVDERSHIFSVEGAMELNRYLQGVEKWAYRLGRFRNTTGDWTGIDTLLWINRFNYHVTRKWDVGLEYRMLFQLNDVHSLRHGPLVEIDREVYDYVRFGIGYNFTDFDDNLHTSSNFRRNGLFIRLTGKV